MTVIRHQNAIDVYVDSTQNMLVITEKNGHYDEQSGRYSDVFVNIDPVHLDQLMDALARCKKILLDQGKK